MEKSIESIWKDGFLESNALVAPKINNLYNQKSKDSIDKFKRMGKINLYVIGAAAFFVLVGSFYADVPYVGAIMFSLFSIIVIIGLRQGHKLEKLDKGESSYQYLKAFDQWLKASIAEYARVYKYIYPLIFLSAIVGTMYSSLFENAKGERTIDIIMNDPDTYLMNGLPVFWILGVTLFIGLVAYFSDILFKFDLNSIYGRIFKKLDELLTEMEELRA